MLWCLIMATAASAATPTPRELASTSRWVRSAFLGEELPLPDGPGLLVLSQEWGTFRVNRAITDTPLRIGDREFTRGLGSHAPSEILVRLPGAAARFEAHVGVDNGPFTAGGLGSVTFSVHANGQELYHSPLLRGTEASQEVSVGLEDATELTLRIHDGGDDVHSDVADWAEARVTLANGETLYLDELPVLQGPVIPSPEPPFSFTLDGKPSRELLPNWERSVEAVDDETTRINYRDPDSGLAVICTLRTFADFPAADWVLEFENTSDADSPLLENVLPLDVSFSLPRGEYTHLRHSRGSTCEIDDFLPFDEDLEAGKGFDLAPMGGRSSNGTLPFYNVDWTTGGALVAVGWSGHWQAHVGRLEQDRLHLTAGQQTCRLRLKPGEMIRSPRMLVLLWDGDDKPRSYNLFRQLLLTHYCPRGTDGELLLPPVAHPTAAVLCAAGEPGNEQNQLEMLRAAAEVGCEVYWLDAYWFPGYFPNGVGTWRPRPEDYPRGLRPLADEAHRLGMEFCLWFEPERVFHTSDIGREHPEYCLGGGEQRLYNLADPEALRYMTGLLNAAVDEHGIDIYREDFNIDPLPFWQGADQPEREGLTEIRFNEGLYAMWDGLVEKHPGMPLDNCASGGRRIDLETVRRSWALWRSDFQDIGILGRPNHTWVASIAGQVQNAALTQYVPFSTSALYAFDPYTFRSTMSAGVPCYMDLRDPALDRDQARAAITELKSLRKYWLGDIHALTPITVSSADWCAYQLDRPDLGEGIALYFRRHESPYLGIAANLRGIDPVATYEVSLAPDYAEPDAQRMTGERLATLPIVIEDKPGCILLRYRKVPE